MTYDEFGFAYLRIAGQSKQVGMEHNLGLYAPLALLKPWCSDYLYIPTHVDVKINVPS